MQTGNTDSIHKNNLDKACFQHNMAYCKSKDLARRIESDKVSNHMQSLSKYNKGIKYLLCSIDLISKYSWLFLWKTKKELVLLMHFKK